jgi:divalent metal cation (Fe/Co/Zn/Cd) transporter
VHNVFVHRGKDHLYVDLDLEVERSLTLSEAHAEADRLERELRNRMPQVHRINVHIEPRHMDVMEDRDVTWGADGVVDLVRRTAMDVPGMKECHDILVRKSGRSLFVSIHCLFDGRLLMGEVHESITSYEHRLRREIPDLERVLIHTEPAEDHAPAEEP